MAIGSIFRCQPPLCDRLHGRCRKAAVGLRRLGRVRTYGMVRRGREQADLRRPIPRVFSRWILRRRIPKRGRRREAVFVKSSPVGALMADDPRNGRSGCVPKQRSNHRSLQRTSSTSAAVSRAFRSAGSGGDHQPPKWTGPAECPSDSHTAQRRAAVQHWSDSWLSLPPTS